MDDGGAQSVALALLWHTDEKRICAGEYGTGLHSACSTDGGASSGLPCNGQLLGAQWAQDGDLPYAPHESTRPLAELQVP